MIVRHRATLILVVVFLGNMLFATPAGLAADDPPSAAATYDCGTLALYTLLRLEKRPIDLAAVEARLPSPTPSGHSMRQIRDAARACGLNLIGVRLSTRKGALDRPALVFLKDGGHGHFVVIRPIGQSGTLVQVLDANRMPDVVDAANLYASPEWTGFALIPDPPNRALQTAVAAALAGSLTCAAAILIPRLRRKPRELAAAGSPESPTNAARCSDIA